MNHDTDMNHDTNMIQTWLLILLQRIDTEILSNFYLFLFLVDF